MKLLPYQFAVLKYTHNISRGEHANFGIVMWLPTERKLSFQIDDHYGQLGKFFTGFDGLAYQRIVRGVEQRAKEATRDLDERVRDFFKKDPEGLDDILPAIVPESGSALSTSQIMSGVHEDPFRRLADLAAELVAHPKGDLRERVDEDEIVSRVDVRLKKAGLMPRLRTDQELKHGEYSHRFAKAWDNGRLQVLEPISFDYLEKNAIVDKASTWVGRLVELGKGRDFLMTGVVVGPQTKALEKAFRQALTLLKGAPHVREVVAAEDFGDFIPKIERDLESRKSH